MLKDITLDDVEKFYPELPDEKLIEMIETVQINYDEETMSTLLYHYPRIGHVIYWHPNQPAEFILEEAKHPPN